VYAVISVVGGETKKVRKPLVEFLQSRGGKNIFDRGQLQPCGKNSIVKML
jgi:hypothetical protein